MAKVKAPGPTKKIRPALSPEARQNQLISLAIDLVEQRLIDGTASAQETVHFLKLATPKYKVEQEILEREKDLVSAKTEAIKSTEELKGIYTEAIKAMRNYSGQGDPDEYEN